MKFPPIFMVLIVILSTAACYDLRRGEPSEGRMYLASTIRTQMDYVAIAAEFPKKFVRFQPGIRAKSAYYRMSVQAAPLVGIAYAVPLQVEHRSYVSGVFITGESTGHYPIKTVGIVCESDQLGNTRPATPKVEGDQIRCGSGTHLRIDSSAFIVDGELILGSEIPSRDYEKLLQLNQDAVLAYRAVDYANGRDYEQAMQIANSLQSSIFKDRVLLAVVESMTSSQQFDPAFESIQEINDPVVQIAALRQMAYQLSTSGQTKRAIEIYRASIQKANSLINDNKKYHALLNIADSLAPTLPHTETSSILKELKKAAYKITSSSLRKSILSFLSEH